MWKLKPDKVGEYIEVHKRVWPSVIAAAKRAGISNYTIFIQGNILFSYMEVEDYEAAMRYVGQDPECQRWNAITSKMIEDFPDYKKGEATALMFEAFHLD